MIKRHAREFDPATLVIELHKYSTLYEHAKKLENDLAKIKDWYHRDGSVGGLANLMSEIFENEPD